MVGSRVIACVGRRVFLWLLEVSPIREPEFDAGTATTCLLGVVVRGDAHGINASQKLYYHCPFRGVPPQPSHVRHLVSSSAPWTFTFLRNSTTSSVTWRYSSSWYLIAPSRGTSGC